jgi:predicted  nucleic acid-binding Zn-ribbon protein
MPISEQFKIVLEDINQKFDILIEGHNGLNKKFDKIDREIEDRQAADGALLKEIRELKTDLNDHRNNTELHGERKQRKTS